MKQLMTEIITELHMSMIAIFSHTTNGRFKNIDR